MLIPPERSGASVQRRYISSEIFDFCIDDGKRVALLTRDSDVWQNIEAGTRIVMRVVFERQAFFYVPYHECHLCGAWSKLGAFSNTPGWLTDDSLDWFVLCMHSLIKLFISHGKVMRAKDDFKSRMIETGRRKA